jgi:hypothetical protein
MTKQEQVWHCAVKNTTTDKQKWYYHLFYDFDGIKLSPNDINWIVSFMKERAMSFILRKTMHGYHLIGLTPVDSYVWGCSFSIMQATYPTYHDGQAIRITKKEAGEFIILAQNYDFPYVEKLAKLFSHSYSRVFMITANAIKDQWYVLIYYTVNKKNLQNKQVVGMHKRK